LPNHLAQITLVENLPEGKAMQKTTIWEQYQPWFIEAAAGQQLQTMEKFIEDFLHGAALTDQEKVAFRKALANLDWNLYQYKILIPLGNALSFHDQNKRNRVRQDIGIFIHAECGRWGLTYQQVEAFLDALFSQAEPDEEAVLR
jgi:hypothetical protein